MDSKYKHVVDYLQIQDGDFGNATKYFTRLLLRGFQRATTIYHKEE